MYRLIFPARGVFRHAGMDVSAFKTLDFSLLLETINVNYSRSTVIL
jgi:hypothetical protein